ncbi:PEGA domain-containing protein [Granulicella rosea]|uniref:PEGA domain-containing protein n=2 Tax=Granulicella rosea TaxID=474952 RepID=A0A239LM88_9BACT|nr:PEGA domain-containing protein [Granulicella rosea]
MSASGGGGGNRSGGGFASSASGGARPQTAEIIKTFGQRCPQVIINNLPQMVDYVVELDHEGGKSFLAHKDKVAVFVRTNGDSIFSESTLSVGGSVQDSCKAILAHWSAHATELKSAAAAAAAVAAAPAAPIVVQTAAAPAVAQGVSVEASVPNCDIEVDDEFVGNTPSVVTLKPGKHKIVVKKKGFEDWSRNITYSGGTVRLNADMTAK